uniref:NADH-ubiquinone oxidoreductase chain 6 n=1 Tax=Pelodytes cf. punctatus II-2011 TaxID=1005956 RepID=K9JYW7_9ANUR|nr:NADH dehydrogenase subunit 6 [Pelodytes cf. punctatus II-2011]AEC33173.1 NADH dehydrogenase subunit 6 [Pelodytes cf. punctatus II-2011]
MNYLMSFFMMVLVLGLVAVASNPSPYFAALGLVVVSAAGCWVIISTGASFLSLVLFLVYLGGMMVVFAYSAALTAEPFPEAWGSLVVVWYVLVYLVVLTVGYFLIKDVVTGEVFLSNGLEVVLGDWSGVALLYSNGGVLLFVGGWVLLLTLFVVLELVRGYSSGALRAV